MRIKTRVISTFYGTMLFPGRTEMKIPASHSIYVWIQIRPSLVYNGTNPIILCKLSHSRILGLLS